MVMAPSATSQPDQPYDGTSKVIHFINGAQGDGSFLASAARGLAGGSAGKLTFAGPEDRMLDFRIFTSIQDGEMVERMEGFVVIVPDAESPGPSR